MPKKPTTTAARRAREAAQAGEKYTTALRAQDGAQQPPDARRSALDEAVAAFWRNHHELEEAQESGLDPRDPYFAAGILDRRALIWGELSQAADKVEAIPAPYSTACAFAAMFDNEHAAQIRFANGIPTILPKTEASKLHLDEMRCRTCGQPWQTDRPCEQCPRILWGTTPTSLAEAERFPAGEPWPSIEEDEDEGQTAAREEPLDALVQRAAEARAAGIRHPRWYRPGRRPDAVSVLNQVFFPAEEPTARREVSLSWRTLLQELAEVRGEMNAHRGALDGAKEVRNTLEYTGRERHYAAGSRRADAVINRIWTELERAQTRYVQLANHALAAAAGEADPGTLPAQIDPDAFPQAPAPEPTIPQALAALGYALPHVHKAMPTSGRLAESLQDDYDRAFGLDDDHECYSEDGRCDCDPYYIPERLTDQAGEMEDEIGHAWEAYHEETVVWADAVCIALATELRPRVFAHDDGVHGWRS